ncbi:MULTISPECIES: NUDIX hydrolase [Micrococcales]|uniref:NUDIX hydrolase n=1 Tax=Micrococcales TaxID=85006 RepID=UPI0010C7A98C|nr:MULTISPECIES: NUDIX hydrolase [Actinomycetes]MBM7824053.1 8-oxo-dGTP diphosphatase [Kocuria palustris]MCX0276480.1 NUDIX hydrolase [Nocardia zapadnayensis]MDH5152911.1 NUDIX hydrolase [Kocuria palustris]QCP05618.1 NUDIX domain-containing protein [Brevibacterium sp. CS2]
MSHAVVVPDTSSFDAHPRVAVISVLIKDDHVLLARRANPPDAGFWGFPGGKIEFGETIAQAAERELSEETSIISEATGVLTCLDAFSRDENRPLVSHFVLVAVLCRWRSGQPHAGDDALEARWFALDEVDEARLTLSKDVAEVARYAATRQQKEVCA